MAALSHIHNFHSFSAAFAIAGQPTEEQFADIAAAGYEVVVNMAWPTDETGLEDEDLFVEDNGMEYIALPVRWLNPTVPDAQRFFDIMDGLAGRRVFVHCISNRRVATFSFLYRTLRQGVSPRVAAQDLVRFWTPNRVWLEFIQAVRAAEAGLK